MEERTAEAKFNELVDIVAGYASEKDLERLRDAYRVSMQMHSGKRWINGEKYIFHPIELATVLARMEQDIPSLAAALTHDCSDDTREVEEAVAGRVGDEVSGLLAGLGKLRGLEARSRDLEQVDSLRRMIIAEARDLRTLILHLADHSQVMLNLESFPEHERARLLELSTKVYAPLSGRLGIQRLKSSLEDLGFMHTNPGEYEEIVRALSETKIERERYITEVSDMLRSMLGEKGIEAEIFGRVKHVRSIYQKMLRQNVSIEGIYDIIAFRIIVDSEQKCWEVLGILHGRWSPIPGRFRDYISAPKKNGYRSLHTSVIGPRKEKMEVQIRTREMHRVAEEGIAAHWRYKEKRAGPSDAAERRLEWITSSLKEGGDEAAAGGENVFSSEIYVFTPAGAVIALPRGATPIDFAYAIHTTVGERCRSALVNGAMVPLSHKLRSGDLVKIVTKAGHHPNQDWLEIAVTSKARSKIRSYLNAVRRREQAARGKEAVEKFLRERSISLHKMEKKGRLKKVREELKSTSMDDIYLKVASGRIDPDEIYHILQPPEEKPAGDGDADRIFEGIERSSGEILVGDIGNLMVRFAGCCSPLPGDEVKGFITRGRGITIHRSTCPNLLAGDEERIIDITWDIGRGMKAKAGLKILTEGAGGMLAKLTQVIASRGVNVTAARAERTRDGDTLNLFTFEVSGTSELLSLIRVIEKVGGVKGIERV